MITGIFSYFLIAETLQISLIELSKKRIGRHCL